MAGYLFSLSDTKSLYETMERGVYSTLVNPKWNLPVQSTLGDYVTMSAGDSLYFFSDRKVYGIGRLVTIEGNDVVMENFSGATSKEELTEDSYNGKALVEPAFQTVKQNSKYVTRVMRWVIAFEPDPCMFTRGIDMDDLLSSDPLAFKSIRTFWKRSFIKLDDQEDTAFRTSILRRNLEVLRMYKSRAQQPERSYLAEHERLLAQTESVDTSLKMQELFASVRSSTGTFSSEMMVEVAILYQLANHDADSEKVFGRWDYLSHQVHASPYKPVDYMDKMDVFGYRYIEGFEPVIEKYLVLEVKAGTATGGDLQQVMKYVDWVRQEYANGDYSLVSAFLVASNFKYDAIKSEMPTTERHGLVGYRPPVPYRWNDITLVRYSAGKDGVVHFSKCEP